MDQPLISVLMTAYNREKYIAESIESVLRSTYTNFELIIVDDTSSDETVQIARSYEEKDNRVKVFINEKNLGDYPNRNKAASYAAGKYLKYVDSDDRIYPQTLEIMVEAMERYPEASLGISSRYENKPGVGQFHLLSPGEAYQKHFFEFGFLDNGPSFTIVKRSAFEEMGGFGLKRNVSDMEMWLKMSSKYNTVLMPAELIIWRQHPDQEFHVAPDCYLEHSYTILKTVLSKQDSPLPEASSQSILKKYKKITLINIVKHFRSNKSIKRCSELMKMNGLKLKDYFIFLREKRH